MRSAFPSKLHIQPPWASRRISIEARSCRSLSRASPQSTEDLTLLAEDQCRHPDNTRSRRKALLGLMAIGLSCQAWTMPVQAGEPEVPLKKHISKSLSAPRMFLLQRLRANEGAKILAPIRASKQRLQEAEKVLRGLNVYDPSPNGYKKVLQSIRAASMNCYTFESLSDDTFETKASLFQKSIGFGDACTYRLIAKNVTNLLTQSQQDLKVKTMKSLTELINSYQLLDDMVDRARDTDPGAIERIPDLLQFTIAHVNSFETNIQRCLDIPVSNLAPTLTS